MEFWKWYLKGILNTPRYLISPWGEYTICVFVCVISSILLTVLVSPFYLFLTLSVGGTIAAHAFWRMRDKK